MISKSPEIISYIEVSSVLQNGETLETENLIENIRCSFQEGTSSYKVEINGSEIVYSHFISITEISEMNKLSNFSINDKIVYNGKEYKVLSARKRQMHIEIYV